MEKKRGRILLVDDDADFVECVRLALERERHEVFVAANGAAGLELAARERPDVIIADLLMAPEDGFATCEELRSRPETKHSAILVVSAIGRKMHKTFASVEVGTRLDVDGFLEKPVELKTLMAAVEEMLKLARSRRTPAGEGT